MEPPNEGVPCSRIPSIAQRFLGMPGDGHCELLEGRVVSPVHKTILERPTLPRRLYNLEMDLDNVDAMEM